MNIKSRNSLILLLCSILLGACQGTSTPFPATPTSTRAVPKATFTPVPPTATPVPNSIRLTKYISNYTAFKIEMQGGPTVITDPFLMDEKVHADIVTESHQHGDHTEVVSILPPYDLLKEPGSFDIAGIHIEGILGVHNKPASRNLDNPNVIYVFDFGNIRLAEFGSQGDLPSPAMFAQIGKVDVLIIQIFRYHNSKLTPGEAEEIARRLSARVIIPAHGDPGANEEFAQHFGADFRREPSGILNLSRSELDQIKTPIVIVLDH